jgi:hypothetical protein
LFPAEFTLDSFKGEIECGLILLSQFGKLSCSNYKDQVTTRVKVRIECQDGKINNIKVTYKKGVLQVGSLSFVIG